MKVFVLAALFAAVAASRLTGESNVDQPQWPWQVGKLYRYDVESHTLARLQEGPSTGNAFRARFVVRIKSPGKLQARLENPQHSQVHHELKNHWTLPEDLEYRPVQSLEQTFEISLDGGRVLSLSLPSSLPIAEENLLKGLIGSLQVDLSTHRNIQGSQNTYDKETRQGQFRKMETDVTGDCETLYTVSPVASEWRRELPNFDQAEDPVEITKSKSYGHCHHRVAYHFGVPKGAEWTGTAHNPNEEQFIKRATISRILVGKQGPIYKAETTSTVHVHPHLYGKQKAEVVSYIKLTLVDHEQDKESEWQKPEGYRVIQNLLYAMSSKQVTIQDRNWSSSEEEQEQPIVEVEQSLRRESRSVRPSKILAINKRIIASKHSDEDSEESNTSKDSSATYVNEDMPTMNEPAFATSYMKQNPMNAQKLVQELAQQMQNPNNMPKVDFLSKFNILVRVLASMSYEQLAQTSRSIEVAKSSNNIVKSDMWMIYRDAIAQAGSPSAFLLIQSWIQKKRIQGEEAAQVVASMVNTLHYPTKELMTLFFKLAMSPEVTEQRHLNSTALIAATRFINMGQVNNETAHSYYPTHLYGRLSRKHDNFVLEQVLPRLRQVLEQSIIKGDSQKTQVYIKAIGNLGHRSILDVFAPYLEGKIYVSHYLRALMVDNLKVLAESRDQYARAVLYSILRNTAEPYEVRVAAIQNIFIARPTSAMMQAMAQMTHIDPSMQVRATLKSGIETAAKLKNPRYWDLARTAQAARDMLTTDKFGEQFSTTKFVDLFDSDYELGIMAKMTHTGSEDNLFPKNFEYRLRSKTSGWNVISASFSSFQQFVDYYQQQWQLSSRSEPKHKYSAEKISEMLKIKRDPKNPLEAALHINLMNQERYLTVAEDDLERLSSFMREYFQEMSKGIDKHYTKVLNQAQVSVVFPVCTGMPFIFKYKEPTFIHMQGKVKADIKYPKDFSGSIEKEIQFTYGRNLDGSVGFLDTLAKQMSSVGIVSKLQLNIPVKIQVQFNMRPKELKIQLEPLRPDQDTTILHYSVWPYSASQKDDSLVPPSLDPSTKLISRNNKVVSTDSKFGQSTGTLFHLQGYSYSSDYMSLSTMFPTSNPLKNIALALYQKDIALTHYNFKYLGKQSQTKRVNLIAVYDWFINQKQNADKSLVASDWEDVTPNSEARRLEMVKRVVSGINTAKAQVVDLSAIFEGQQKTEYVLTAAIGDSPVDSKIQYMFFAGRNSDQQVNSQVNGVGTVQRPQIISMNFLEALQKDLKMNFQADIKYSKENNGNIRIEGFTERTKKYAEELMKHPLARQCANEIAHNNYYQHACHKMIVMAYAPDFFKASVTYKDVSPAVKYMIYRTFRIAESFGFWYTDMNPLKTTPDGKLDIEVQTSYLDHYVNMVVNSKYGECRIRNAPIPEVTSGALSTYFIFKPYERIFNYYFGHQYQPYCSVDGSSIRTFSNRRYDYTLTRSWHVVMQDKTSGNKEWQKKNDELVVLARRPNEKQQEIYISYSTDSNQHLEIEMQPAPEGSIKPHMKVNTNSKKVSDGELTLYWDDVSQSPLLQYYTLPDGVVMLNIRENRLRIMYDGQRLVVLARENRNNTRGICGYMSGEPRDDFLTPQGMVDKPEHYAASYALNDEHSEPKTQQLQSEAMKLAYQPQYKCTTILRSDSEWKSAMQLEEEENWGSQKVYRARSYSKQLGQCQLQEQVQYYENHGEICITTRPVASCQSHCSGEDYKVQPVQVVCRPKFDEEFQNYKNQIRQGQNPEVSGVPQNRHYRVPTSCNV